MNSATRTFKHTINESMNEERTASEDEPGTVQLGNEKRRKTQLYVEACQQELKNLSSGRQQEGNNPTKEGGVAKL